MDEPLRSIKENSFNILFVDDIQADDGQPCHTPGTPQNEVGMLEQPSIPTSTLSDIPKVALPIITKVPIDPIIAEFDFKLKLIISCTIGWSVAMGLSLLILRIVEWNQ